MTWCACAVSVAYKLLNMTLNVTRWGERKKCDEIGRRKRCDEIGRRKRCDGTEGE